MRIGVDASCWLNRRGFGRYTREVLRAMLELDDQNEYVFFLDAITARDAEELPVSDRVQRVVIETSAAATRAAAADGSRSPGDLWRMRQAVARWNGKLDVFYFPADYTYFPIRTTARVIVTKHDMTDRRVPHLLFPTWRSRFLWEVKIRMAMRRSDMVFTVSDTSRRDIMEAFGLGPDRVRVVLDAVDPGFIPSPAGVERSSVLARYGIAADTAFFLYVGGISPHKNLDTLVRAYDHWVRGAGRSGAPVSLVLVGDYKGDVFHSSYESIRGIIAAAGLEDRVRFTGYVADADLRHLYSAATALVLPSFYEGFGLPVVEAMACGTPVLASDAGALPEVVGGVGLLFDPHSPESIAAAMERLLGDTDLQQRFSEQGIARARTFTWDVAARAALRAFEDVVR